MKILWVKAGKLVPLDSGGRIRSYHILKELTRRHEVNLFSYYVGRQDEAYEQEVLRHFPGAVVENIGAPEDSLPGRLWGFLRRLPAPAPYTVTRFTDAKVQHRIAGWFNERRFDVAVCDFLAVSLSFPKVLTIPTVLFQHNVESELWRRRALEERNWLKRIIYQLEAAKMFRYESATVSRFPHVIAVSEQDRDLMAAMTDALKITVVPTGVDLKKYRAAAGASSTRSLVVFTGSMDWDPNIDGVEFFCREVWPQVRVRVPAAQFRIVGRNPHRRVQALASDSVEVTGTVPSVTEHLREAAVITVPLRIGGGTRLKIYEAMAMGKAIVSTSIGAEGLEVHPDRAILLADDPESFANLVVRLLRDLEFRQRIEKAAAELVTQYDWSVVSERFEEVLKRVVAGAASATPVSAGVAPMRA